MAPLAHIGICSSDTEQLAGWYQRVLGLERLSSNGQTPPTIFARTSDGVSLEFYPAVEGAREPHPQQEGLRHLAFVTTDIEQEATRLADAEVSPMGAVTTHPSGAQTLFFRDVDGNVLHFLQR